MSSGVLANVVRDTGPRCARAFVLPAGTFRAEYRARGACGGCALDIEPRSDVILGSRRIGLLGGSFNPAHEGHRHISLIALKRLGLHEVWWMLTPQNPLKNSSDTAPFQERLKAATRVAMHPRIRVTDIEKGLGTAHTADTLALLLPRFPKCRFVWLMGADNLVQVSEWKNWRRIFRLVPIAVFARPPYSKSALVARASRVFADSRVAEWRASSMAMMSPPAWVFLHTRPHAGSATRIRARKASASGKRAPMMIASGQH